MEMKLTPRQEREMASLRQDLRNSDKKAQSIESNISWAEKQEDVSEHSIGLLRGYLSDVMKGINWLLDMWLEYRLPKHDENGEEVPYDED
jgi:hypothetical protein